MGPYQDRIDITRYDDKDIQRCHGGGKVFIDVNKNNDGEGLKRHVEGKQIEADLNLIKTANINIYIFSYKFKPVFYPY